MCSGVLSNYNSLMDVVSQALGGSSEPTAAAVGHADVSGGVDKAVANLNQLLTF